MRYCLGPPDNHSNIWAALAFMPFGLFFDFMDGKVARWRGKSSLMGQELDSLADLVCLFPQPQPPFPFSPPFPLTIPYIIYKIIVLKRWMGITRYPSASPPPPPLSPSVSAPPSTLSSSLSSFSAASHASHGLTLLFRRFLKMLRGSLNISRVRLFLRLWGLFLQWRCVCGMGWWREGIGGW